MDEVQKKRVPVLITKRGKPVAKLVPVEQESKNDDLFGFMKGQGRIVGDIVSPALTREEWGSLWPEDD
jgi:antitoxin (DNA-binding transcriptional repressor) of toxin-antitoxin stability system